MFVNSKSMLRILFFNFLVYNVNGYFTLPGKCPEQVPLMESFSLSEFYGKWHQAYYYSSDQRSQNNCSTIEFTIKSTGGSPKVSFNQTRVDNKYFQKYSIAKVSPTKSNGSDASIELTFTYKNGPRRLKTRRYQFEVLTTNYNYFATAYTCQYSPLIDKHFIYVWILSRKPILNDVSKELALKPLHHIGVGSQQLIKDDLSLCKTKFYDDYNNEPTTFRFPVPI